MDGRRQIRFTLSLGLAVLLSAVATAPLWHASHQAPVEPAVEQDHTHSGMNTGLCDESTGSPETDCSLCQTKRLLSTSLAGQPDSSLGPPPDAGVQGELVLHTVAGERLAASARAPPLS
mgnify:CR=1 FL=1